MVHCRRDDRGRCRVCKVVLPDEKLEIRLGIATGQAEVQEGIVAQAVIIGLLVDVRNEQA